MKATIDIPEDLYRRVKAQSALQARTVREVTVELYRAWVDGNSVTTTVAEPSAQTPRPSWFAGAKSYAEKVHAHDMPSVRTSVARARTKERGSE